VHWFQYAPILMIILAVVGKLLTIIRWQSVGLVILIIPVQYVTVHIPSLGALHPVIAEVSVSVRSKGLNYGLGCYELRLPFF
jgi:hypothetical protein